MMIKINDKYSIERDRYCWNLHEYREGVNPKTKEPTISKHTTYHSDLEQICSTVLDKSGEEIKEVNDLMDAIFKAKQELLMAIRGCANNKPAKDGDQ